MRDVSRQGNSVAMVLDGEIDLHTAGIVEAVIDRECKRSPTRLVVDLSAVEFLDSTGLHLLLRAHARLAAAGCALVLLRPSENARRALAISGVDRLLPIDEGAGPGGEAA